MWPNREGGEIETALTHQGPASSPDNHGNSRDGVSGGLFVLP